jgi:hypothetical protein
MLKHNLSAHTPLPKNANLKFIKTLKNVIEGREGIKSFR